VGGGERQLAQALTARAGRPGEPRPDLHLALGPAVTGERAAAEEERDRARDLRRGGARAGGAVAGHPPLPPPASPLRPPAPRPPPPPSPPSRSPGGPNTRTATREGPLFPPPSRSSNLSFTPANAGMRSRSNFRTLEAPSSLAKAGTR